MFLLHSKVSQPYAYTYPLLPGLMNLSLIKFFMKLIAADEVLTHWELFFPQSCHHCCHHSSMPPCHGDRTESRPVTHAWKPWECCSVAKSCPTLLRDPMDCSRPGLPVRHYMLIDAAPTQDGGGGKVSLNLFSSSLPSWYWLCLLLLGFLSHHLVDRFSQQVPRNPLLHRASHPHLQAPAPWPFKVSFTPLGTPLVAQWLRFHAPHAGVPSFIPGWGTRS